MILIYNFSQKLQVQEYFHKDMYKPPNGERYPLVGGTRQRCFDGINSKPRKLLENAQTPTSRVHAVLGGVCLVFTDPAAMVHRFVVLLHIPEVAHHHAHEFG